MKKSLRMLLKKNSLTTLPGAFNPFTAKLIEANGFKGVYLSGAGLANSFGLTDTGIIGLKEFIETGSRIVKSINIPLLTDADTGFENIEETVKAYIQSGVSGLHIEDQVFPKRCGHLAGKEVVPKIEMVEKIKKAVAVRNAFDPEFLIIARTDARGAQNIAEKKQLEECIVRGNSYLEAGAEMIFPEALRSKEEFMTYRKEVQCYLLANMTEFGKSPFLTSKEFEEMGFNMVIFPVTLFRYSAGFINKALEKLKIDGNQKELVADMMTREEINNLLDYEPGFPG